MQKKENQYFALSEDPHTQFFYITKIKGSSRITQ